MSPLKMANVAGYLLFLGSSICTMIPPRQFYENIKQTYFTPSIWIFFVWPIVHILLLGPVVYQFVSARGKALVVDRISWELPLLTTLSAVFVVVWANHYHTAAFALSFVISYIICNVNWTLKKEHSLGSVADELLVNLPLSVWQAWTVVISYLTAFEAFGVAATEDQNGFWTNIFVFFALLTLQFGVAVFALSSAIGDRPAIFVFSWTLWAICDHQHSSGFIHGSAKGFFILSLLWDLKVLDSIYRKCTGRPNLFAQGESRQEKSGLSSTQAFGRGSAFGPNLRTLNRDIYR